MERNSEFAFGIAQKLLIAGVLFIVAANLFFSFEVGNSLGKQASSLSNLIEPAGPAIAKITITKLNFSRCSDCFDLSAMIDSIKGLNAEFVEKTVEFDSAEGKQLAERYSIDRVPALILTGDTKEVPELVSAWEQVGSIENDNALVLRNNPPVYWSLSSNKFIGRVKLTSLVDTRCEICNKQVSRENLENMGVVIASFEELQYDSDAGKQLIEKYSVKKVPTVILSEDIKEYSGLIESLLLMGGIEEDGAYVLREPPPVYFDLGEYRLVGKTTVVYLSDKDCSECYDVNVHKEIFTNNFGLYLDKERHVDIGSLEGKKIVKDYNISLVPTILLSGDVNYYKNLGDVWAQVGTVEKDGTYVFRELKALQNAIYKNITTGELIGKTSSEGA